MDNSNKCPLQFKPGYFFTTFENKDSGLNNLIFQMAME
jgi:hypothetical protein